MNDLRLEFRGSGEDIVAHAANESIQLSGSGMSRVEATRDLEKALQTQLGPVFDYTIDLNGGLVRLKQK